MTKDLLRWQLLRLSRCTKKRSQLHRAFQTSCSKRSAHEFAMPAMSPTMTEGNITSWKVKEGDTFTAGDVLLEIETDKAQMDVEAQDDGIMAKIIAKEGAKGVKVGTHIAITADPDDDISRLDFSAIKPSSDQETRRTSESEQAPDTPSKSLEDSTPRTADVASIQRNAAYPLFPSVIQLIHANHLSEEEIGKISATGPNGRLLKGDVLAYIGSIGAKYPEDQSKRIRALEHLNLSNIELKASTTPKQAVEPQQADVQMQETTPVTVTEITLPISLSAVNEVRQRIRKVLGIDVAVETFIARATQICNEDLPRSRNIECTQDELFNSILGLPHDSTVKTGPILLPSISSSQRIKGPSRRVGKESDVIDQLIAEPRNPYTRDLSVSQKIDPRFDVFSVTVSPGDEARGKVFLERLKNILQVEPGRLIL